ncbi:hypothetical protein I4U23_015553 [Adineta vaga]|nr:hypothetical protein I4U23_015553 [Adineta vaga]
MATSIDVNRRLIMSFRDEPKQMLQPISGYEEEQLVSLEEACQPLENILDSELKQNIMIAKINSIEPKDGLNVDESASIHLYTMEWKVHENSLYAVLNRTLRLPDRSKLRPWFKYLKLFLTAFFKLPSTERRTVYRGVPENLNDLYPTGKKVTWWSVSSCTASLQVLQYPYYVGTSGVRTMFHIETNSGKIIRSHSHYQHEDEILLPPGLYLEVISNFNPAPGLYMIQLREIQPPFKLLAEPFDLNRKIHKTTTTTELLIKQSKGPQITTSNELLYSNRKLDCHGRACIRCGFCRDWCWCSHGSSGSKTYKRRQNTTCTASNYSCGRGYYYYHNSYRLCECEDNILQTK